MHDFSKIAASLTKLTKKEEKYVYSEECASAFKELKNKLITAHILKIPSGHEVWSYIVMQGKVWDVY